MKKYSDIISGAVLFVLAAVYYAMATQIKQYNSRPAGDHHLGFHSESIRHRRDGAQRHP